MEIFGLGCNGDVRAKSDSGIKQTRRQNWQSESNEWNFVNDIATTGARGNI